MASRFPHSEDAAKLGTRLRQARLMRNLTQQALSEETGIERSQISKIERGRARTLNENVQGLCNFLSIPSSDGPEANSADIQLLGLLARLQTLATDAPQLRPAIDAALGALEAIARTDSSSGVEANAGPLRA